MLVLTCKGTPYEIGYTHGAGAKKQIEGSIAFYAKVFLDNSKKTWPEVLETATSFATSIQAKWPRYYQEIQGIADGSKRSIVDIIALNVRTEIAFGQFSDGCTSLSWKSHSGSLLGQNWDWQTEQKENLVLLTIEAEGRPIITMVTEGGIIGKIGLNDQGVGVCLNAIRAKGCDVLKMPVHLGLRAVLESSSVQEAIKLLETHGMASSAHFLIADQEEAVGLEFTPKTFAKLLINSHGRIIHTNHFILEHAGVHESNWLKPDSKFRISRMTTLVTESFDDIGKEPALLEFSGLFEDEQGYPASICRAEEGQSDCATLFNICMDLRARTAILKLGRPSMPEEIVEIRFRS